MPHLQFDINKKLEKKFNDEFEKENLSLGRVNNIDHVCLMNLDIRLGRTEKQKIELVKTFIVGVEKFFGVNKNNQYVTLTNHKGNEFNFYEKSLSDWIENDDPNKNFKD